MALDLENAIQTREDQAAVLARVIREQIDEGGVPRALAVWHSDVLVSGAALQVSNANQDG